MPVGVLNRSLGSPHHEYPASQIAAETQCSSRYFSEKVSVAISVELWYMFVLQGGERMKYKLLKDLYDCFCTPPELQAQKQEIDECHHENERSVSRRTAMGLDARFASKEEEK